MPVTPELIKQSLKENPNINVVVLTTPSYEGLAANIQEIGKICSEHGIILVLDSSHGSLFHFIDMLPPSGLDTLGVDIIVNSVHKGAGAASQTSLVHITKNSKILEHKLL
mmetsp:Transcript_41411/g.30441  ORF Transcript_41411/g.30441 Transcript_41411/m.30441 type:complete len:110 (-) Transcript_41411:686-1015(-)